MFPERCSRGVFEAKRRAARGSFRRSYSRTYRSDTGEHKNDVRGGGGRGRRACSTSYLTRRVTRSVYNDRGTRTHVRIQRRARTRARRILDPSSRARARELKCAVHVQEPPTQHVRTKECRRLRRRSDLSTASRPAPRLGFCEAVLAELRRVQIRARARARPPPFGLLCQNSPPSDLSVRQARNYERPLRPPLAMYNIVKHQRQR